MSAPTFGGIDDIRRYASDLPGPDAQASAAATAREAQLTKPAGALGRLEAAAHWLAAWQGRYPPRLDNLQVRVFAANHGVAARGVSAYPAAVTAQMVRNFEAGGAAINQLCSVAGAGLRVIALDLDRPTADMTQGPAMDDSACVQAVAAGAETVEQGIDLLALGEMGIANTTAAAAICLALYGGQAAAWTGPGTSVGGAALRRKAEVVEEAVEANRSAMTDPLHVLRCVGGREIAALAGAILAARRMRVPVLLDGFVCGAAAAIVRALDPTALDHCLAGHRSAEPAHARLLERLGLRPLLDLDMRLGEATGAALAIVILRGAVACHTGMASFADAGVAGPAK